MTKNNGCEPVASLQAPGADAQGLGPVDLASYDKNYQRPTSSVIDPGFIGLTSRHWPGKPA
jgi:hypothetical protein